MLKINALGKFEKTLISSEMSAIVLDEKILTSEGELLIVLK